MPTPINITLLWNFGSILGLCLIIQIIRGLFLAFRYSPDTILAFKRVNNIINETWNGFLLRNIHANGASLFFICIFIHVGRGIYFKSYNLKKTWTTGTLILLVTIGTAFLGYVLPWGQISFWGSTVITNLISSIPYLGTYLVEWIWGGFSVRNPTLTRFFCIHFILPFLILLIVIIHLLFLHITGSINPLGTNRNINKIKFNPFFIIKDLIGYLFIIFWFTFIITFYPNMFGDNDNFILARNIVTPEHIQPEWYFLFAYAILRSIPRKLGGVIALLRSILILIIIPFLKITIIKRNQFYPFKKFIFWKFTISIILLTWIGIKPVEIPYIILGQYISIIYFLFFFITPIINKYFDKIIY